MDDFFKSVKDNMENRERDIPLQEEDWLAVKKKLNTAKKEQSPRGGLLWWMYLPSLLFLGAMLMNFSLYQQLKAGSANQTQRTTTILQIDTIFKSQVIYQNDTIYQTRIKNNIVYQNVSQTPLSNPTTTQFNTSTINTKTFGTSIKEKLSNQLFTFSPNQTKPGLNYTSISGSKNIRQSDRNNTYSTNNDSNEDSMNQFPIIDKWGLLHLSSQKQMLLADKRSVLQNEEIIPVTPAKKKVVRQTLYKMRPKNIIVGLNAGFLYLPSDLIHRSGSTYGVEADIVFSDHLRMFTEVNFFYARFESLTMGEAIGIPFAEAPADNFVFEEAKLEQKGIRYGVGLKYLFNTKFRFQPYLGIGLSAISIPSYEVQYDFIDPNTQVENEYLVPIESPGLVTNQVLFKAGVEYKFNESWRLVINGSYRHQLGKERLGTPNVGGLRIGLMYRF